MGSSSKISLKLLIDTEKNKVLFAEAGKNCVDFLFHLLSLPLGAAIRLLRKQKLIGSLENLYDSIENLDETYIQPDQNKNIFLSPKSPAGAPASTVTLLALNDAPTPEKIDKAFYTCSNSCLYSSGNLFGSAFASTPIDNGRRCGYVTDDPRTVCPICSRTMSANVKYVAFKQTGGSKKINEGGFVKGVVTYMIMDDLVVKPMSAISSISLINNFDVKDLSALKEKQVDLCKNEALKLLKASLESKTVLTDVFLDDEEKKGCSVKPFSMKNL